MKVPSWAGPLRIPEKEPAFVANDRILTPVPPPTPKPGLWWWGLDLSCLLDVQDGCTSESAGFGCCTSDEVKMEEIPHREGPRRGTQLYLHSSMQVCAFVAVTCERFLQAHSVPRIRYPVSQLKSRLNLLDPTNSPRRARMYCSSHCLIGFRTWETSSQILLRISNDDKVNGDICRQQ